MSLTRICDLCHEEKKGVKVYEVITTKSGYGMSMRLCPKCVKKTELSNSPVKIVKRAKVKKVEAPTICPLMFLALYPVNDEASSLSYRIRKKEFDCQKEKCWWFNRQTKKCVFAMIAMTLGDLVLAQKPLRKRVKPSDLVERRTYQK